MKCVVVNDSSDSAELVLECLVVNGSSDGPEMYKDMFYW